MNYLILVLLFIFSNFIYSEDSFKDVCENKETIIVGDLHGDLSIISEILFDNNMIHENGKWNHLSNKCLVVVGDMIDRGRHSLETYFYLRSLKSQANDRVKLLIGNHELNVLLNKLPLVIRNGGRAWIQKYGFNNFRKVLIDDLNSEIIQASLFLGKKEQLPILITHAGLSESFYERLESTDKKNELKDIENISNYINNFFSNDISFNDIKYDTNTSGYLFFSANNPFEYRGKEYRGNPDNFYSEINQIKGHDYQENLNIKTLKLENNNKVYFIDVALSGPIRDSILKKQYSPRSKNLNPNKFKFLKYHSNNGQPILDTNGVYLRTEFKKYYEKNLLDNIMSNLPELEKLKKLYKTKLSKRFKKKKKLVHKHLLPESPEEDNFCSLCSILIEEPFEGLCDVYNFEKPNIFWVQQWFDDDNTHQRQN